LGCSTPRSVKTAVSERDSAITASTTGDYSAAVQYWTAWFDQQTLANKPADINDYVHAAGDASQGQGMTR
jgi:hypothetical protein